MAAMSTASMDGTSTLDDQTNNEIEEDSTAQVFMQTGLVEEPRAIILSNPYRVLHKSIAVQTDGYFPPYPQGSVWNESPGLRGMLVQQLLGQQQQSQQRGSKKQQKQQLSLSLNSSGWKRTSMGKGSSLSSDKDEESLTNMSMDESNVSSLGYHSHMVANGLDSITSYSEDNHTIKSTSFTAENKLYGGRVDAVKGGSRNRYHDDVIAKVRSYVCCTVLYLISCIG